MCFSAGASFTSAVVLTSIGIVCLKKTTDFSQQLFAAIPFLFGIQQFAEGMLWIYLPQVEHFNIQKDFTYLFLLFAEIFWPFWVPISILMMEKNEKRKVILKLFLAAGIIVSIYLATCLLSFDVEAKIVGKHITYIQKFPMELKGFGIVFYALATVAPAFFSSVKGMRFFGVAIIISYIITAVFFEHYVLSVWCFFSAVISTTIYLIINKIVDFKKVNLKGGVFQFKTTTL